MLPKAVKIQQPAEKWAWGLGVTSEVYKIICIYI